VKATILDVAQQEQLAELNCRHLTRSVDKVQTMVHRLKPTMSELLGTKPCFPLKRLWQFTLIPAIAQLVDIGGPCEGATVVVQQDNAGPHIEAECSTWIHEPFEIFGWMYESQAPQGISFFMPCLVIILMYT
jgi:hypothetical protein